MKNIIVSFIMLIALMGLVLLFNKSYKEGLTVKARVSEFRARQEKEFKRIPMSDTTLIRIIRIIHKKEHEIAVELYSDTTFPVKVTGVDIDFILKE